MSKTFARAGILPAAAVALLLSACGGSDTNKDFGAERLSSCSIEESPFASLPYSEWAYTYHRTVSGVIEANTDTLSNPVCPDNAGNLPQPTDELRALAQQLDPWKSSPARLDKLSEADMGAVLLDYLRTYECAMLEYRTFFYPELVKRAASSASAAAASAGSSASGGAQDAMTVGEFNELRIERENQIAEELRIARQSLHRTLAMTGRLNRLRPAFYDVNCFVAASLDLRNQLGLAAEVGSCLPRIRDAHNSLRDLKDL